MGNYIRNKFQIYDNEFTWHRNKSKAILDYVYVPYYSTDRYQLRIIPTTTISDHQMLYLNAKIYPTRRSNNPQKIIIYPKWKFFINQRSDSNEENYNQMLHQIQIKWTQFSNNHLMETPSINDVTKIFEVAYTIIWQAAHDNGMCTCIPLSHKTYNQRCRTGTYFSHELLQLLDHELELINTQNDLV